MKIINRALANLTLLFCCGLAATAYAADPDIYSHKKRGAIGGADVVAYYSLKPGDDAVLGKRDISQVYQGATWYFSTEENRALFAKQPEKYAPQYGGYCAYAVSQGITASVDPDYWHLVEGRLYLNYNFWVDRKWRKDPQGFILQANDNWPAVLTACEKDDDCGNS